MWFQAEDAHAKLINLANANSIYVQYTGHGYSVHADMIGGASSHLKTFHNEKEAEDFVKDLYQQLL